jgi:non-lysosomal glucosylceramidase
LVLIFVVLRYDRKGLRAMNPVNPLIPYSRESLFKRGEPQIYRGRALDEIAFPLGGIGTGMISIGGWGQLRDFEIFNRPQKGLSFEYTFFTLYAQRGDATPVTRVVQGPVGGVDFTGAGRGLNRFDGAGLPHFRTVTFEGAFPFARLEFDDEQMPLQVAMEAYNPFIPLNPDDSGLPIAIFNFFMHNPKSEPVHATLFANLENKIGFPDVGGGVIEFFEREGVRGLKMSTSLHPPHSPRYGTLALATPHDDVNVQTHWFRGAWYDSLHRFWDQACTGELAENREPAQADGDTDVGSIGLRATLAPGASVRLPVWIAWHNPNFEMYWSNQEPKPIWRNYYATRHEDAVDVVHYVAQNYAALESETRALGDALFSSTLPDSVIDAVSSQISILKTTTCLRLEDGTFYAWEGCNPDSGCCQGTCTHVWNYAQALPYLFPSLARSVREADYAFNLHAEGHMSFRMPLPLGTPGDAAFHAAADGQMGGVLKVYREWLISGDDEWLRALWPSVKKALEYAWLYWDRDRDGVMEGVQHNTYDIEFYGPNTMMSSLYLGALRAAEEMARHLGDGSSAAEYRRLFETGRQIMDATLFNGEFYVQHVRSDAQAQSSHDASVSMGGQAPDPEMPDYPKYQYGEGCLSDQMIGQWYARMLNLGDLFDPEQVRKTMASIFRYNWEDDLSEHANPQRIYAVNGEAGLFLATWPRGGRPALPFVYSDEVWCGVEYQVASHLIYEGLIEEGLTIVKGLRGRHTGVRRNPWNEFECGNHYARSMASYALLLALSGLAYSAPAETLSFAPRVYPEDFACFFALGSGWGMVKQAFGNGTMRAAVEIHSGQLTLRQLGIGFEAPAPRVTLAGLSIGATAEIAGGKTQITFAAPATIRAGQSLLVDAWNEVSS